ncbi:hypothetical protein DSM3645_02953 [Blastopirellula marina DSM 3645]|uniref:Uncharacterized protein n=1 Tax=Blastopirellula marina DSM 3645 TaxID=314230 RepID=A3ZVQ4_9BACT|nr:hypothetical protein DSM3645_02953 [Blastopirellula marina DSM 3645]
MIRAEFRQGDPVWIGQPWND